MGYPKHKNKNATLHKTSTTNKWHESTGTSANISGRYDESTVEIHDGDNVLISNARFNTDDIEVNIGDFVEIEGAGKRKVIKIADGVGLRSTCGKILYLD